MAQQALQQLQAIQSEQNAMAYQAQQNAMNLAQKQQASLADLVATQQVNSMSISTSFYYKDRVIL